MLLLEYARLHPVGQVLQKRSAPRISGDPQDTQLGKTAFIPKFLQPLRAITSLVWAFEFLETVLPHSSYFGSSHFLPSLYEVSNYLSGAWGGGK